MVPGGVWQAARPLTDTEALVSCVVAPAFDYADFALEPPPTAHAEATAVLPRPRAEVWPLVADFAGIAGWHPLIAKATAEPGLPANTPGQLRHLVTEGGAVIRERLLRMGESEGGYECVYEFAESPMEVHDYRATLTLADGPDDGSCRGTWRADFTPHEPAAAAELSRYFADEVFAPGLRALAGS
nr:cupin domain-containing protein [Streptomyces coryli]